MIKGTQEFYAVIAEVVVLVPTLVVGHQSLVKNEVATIGLAYRLVIIATI